MKYKLYEHIFLGISKQIDFKSCLTKSEGKLPDINLHGVPIDLFIQYRGS